MIHIRALTADDLPLGMQLKEQAAWNQTEADWRRLLDMEPEGCFVAEVDGRPVATTATCIFGSVAWVAMVLVDRMARGRGIGTALMQHALAFLDGRGVRTVRLDATPLGRPVYEKFGFVPQFELARREGTLPSAPAVVSVATANQEDWENLLRLDREVTATDRRKWLLRLFADRPDALRVIRQEGEITGFATSRPGSRALYLGPCLASPEAGPLLFTDAWHRGTGQLVCLDIPVDNKPALQMAEAQGLTVQRHLLRMCRGDLIQERVECLWASSGPELG